MYPSQVVRLKAKSPGYQPRSNLMQIAFSILHVKNGTQQTRKTPEIRINNLITEVLFSNWILPICLRTVFCMGDFFHLKVSQFRKQVYITLLVLICTRKQMRIFCINALSKRSNQKNKGTLYVDI